jgi:hypothetical protein
MYILLRVSAGHDITPATEEQKISIWIDTYYLSAWLEIFRDGLTKYPGAGYKKFPF